MKEKEQPTVLVKNIKTGEYEEWTIKPYEKYKKYQKKEKKEAE